MILETYDIKDLYVVKFKKKYLDNLGLSNNFINYFKPNLYYIVERFKDVENDLFYYEIYRECITGQDFYAREEKNEEFSIPYIFESIEQLPLDYLDEEEKNSEKVSSIRLFQIFEEINYQKVKRIKKR